MTATATLDWETYSEAGYTWDSDRCKWVSITDSPPHGIGAVGAAAYAEHPSTRTLCLAYDIHNDGAGRRLWAPCYSTTIPPDLANHIAAGGLLEAWNVGFERHIWRCVAVPRYGWPEVPNEQWRCTMARARAYSLPGKLAHAGAAIHAPIQKLTDGTRLIKKFSVPRNPTSGNPALRLLPEHDEKDGTKLYQYCLVDVESEDAIGAMVPELSPTELEIWRTDQAINARGVAIDRESLEACISAVESESKRLTEELRAITDGIVKSAAELQTMRRWLELQGFPMASLAKDAVQSALERTDLPPTVRRVLEIRTALSASSVKKLYSIRNRLTRDGRLHDLFQYCGADRTGRFAGRGPQPQNLPRTGPDMVKCECGRYHSEGPIWCPHCHSVNGTVVKWSPDVAEDVLATIRTGDLTGMGDPLRLVSGCLRSLFVAGPGMDLLCSDYSSIEAVIMAEVSGEEWRREVFRTHGKIYETSASMISGVPFQEFLDHKARTGQHHPLRSTLGKIAELSWQFAGAVGAAKKAGAEKYIGSDEEIKKVNRQWREQSPKIVQLWYGLERSAIAAVNTPGQPFGYRGITYRMERDTLRCYLPSGRALTYHEPRIYRGTTPWGSETWKLSHMGLDTNKNWVRVDTWYGTLVENMIQGIARDILCYALVNLERAGYTPVLHVHDEPCTEVPEGWGSVEEMERIMATMPPWAEGWPVRAAGGWRGKRFRKG